MSPITRHLIVLASLLSPLAMADCTRVTNPFQDLKDQLNLVSSDLHMADEIGPSDAPSRRTKLGSRILRDWNRFADNAQKKQRPVPADLAKDVKAAAAAVKARRVARGTADLLALSKRVDDFSMTMTCAK